MYAVCFDSKNYDEKNNVYIHDIPWSCILELCESEDVEMVVVRKTVPFRSMFSKAAQLTNRTYDSGLVCYDLDEKIKDPEYIKQIYENPIQSVFHKKKRILFAK